MIEIAQGDGPLVLGLPHTGTEIPPEVLAKLNPVGQARADTDWHIHKLYEGLIPDLTTVRTPIHRYVIDVNRPPEDASLYPGQNTTSLCPRTDFDGKPIYNPGAEPGPAETALRLEAYYAPYHAALSAELARVRERWGVAVLYDCHSIRSEIPYLFEGRLPDFNIGTNGGTSCARQIEADVFRIASAAPGLSTVLNGRFKGGWTTRHHGQPAQGVHAIQMELAQATYMREAPPWEMIPERADALRQHLRAILAALDTLARDGALT